MRRILLVEDHASFRQAMAYLFDREPGFRVVAQAGSVAEAREATKETAHGVDIAVVDLELPDGSGVDVVRGLQEVGGIAAMVLSASVDRSEMALAVEAGAAGVVDKLRRWRRSSARCGVWRTGSRSCRPPRSSSRCALRDADASRRAPHAPRSGT